MAKLVIKSGSRAGESVDLDEGKLLIGRSVRAKLRLSDDGIARNHADVSFDGGSYYIEDRGSDDGTHVGGSAISGKTKLDDGAEIKVGSVTLVFEGGGGAAAGATAEAAPAAAAAAAEEDSGSSRRSRRRRSRRGGDEEEKAEETPAEEEKPKSRRRRSRRRRADADAEEEKPAEEEDTGGRRGRRSRRRGADDSGGGGGAETKLLNDRIEELKKEIAQKDGELEDLRRERLQLKKAERQSKKVPGLQEEVETLNAKLREQIDMNDTLDAERLELQERVTNYESTMSSKQEGMDALIQEKDAQVERIRVQKDKEIGRLKERIHDYEETLVKLRRDIEQFKSDAEYNEDQYNTVVLKNEEIKEKLEILQYQLEETDAKRAEIVREKISDIQNENEDLKDKSSELQSLVEAYEEKIDEMDERIEELEAENEEIETMLSEKDAELKKIEGEDESMSKTLKKQIAQLRNENEAQAKEVEELRQEVHKLEMIRKDLEIKNEELVKQS